MNYLKRFLFALFKSWKPHHSRTVRFAFPALVTTAALMGAVAIFSDDSSYIRLTSSVKQIEENESFSIDVYAGAHVPVNAVDIELRFSKEQVVVTGIDVGESVITIWAHDPEVVGNIVTLQGGTFRKGFLGEHLVATINVTALKKGSATFTANNALFLAGDGSGSTVSLSDSGEESLVISVGSSDGQIFASASVSIDTDIDGDGVVDMSDVRAFMSSWMLRDKKYDFNKDNKMNFTDFAIILSDSFFK